MPAWLLAPRTTPTLEGWLAVPVVEVLEPGDQAGAAEVDLARTWVEADVVRLARPVDEHGHALGSGAEAVRDARARRARDHMPGAQRVRLFLGATVGGDRRRPELERTAALEHDEHLFLERMGMRNRHLVARCTAHPVEPGLLGARFGGDRPVAVLVELDVVEVHDVRGALAGR